MIQYININKLFHSIPKHIHKYFFDKIHSTNVFTKENYNTIMYPNIVIAYGQNNGKGQYNRKWYSPYKKGIYLSIAVSLNNNTLSNPVLLNFIIPYIICVLLNNDVGQYFFIKYPNDIYLNEKKCGGILIETLNTKSKQIIIIGIGINIYSLSNNLYSAIEDVTNNFNSNNFINNLIMKISNIFDKPDRLMYHVNIDNIKKYLIGMNKKANIVLKDNSTFTDIIIDLNIENNWFVFNNKTVKFNDIKRIYL